MNKTVYRYLRNYGSYVVPKKDKFFIFLPTLNQNKFDGNVKALQIYMQREHKEIKTILISHHHRVLQEAREKFNLKASYFFSLRGLWYILRAEYIIIDSSFSGSFQQGKFNLIQLWHGSGYKDVGLSYKVNESNPALKSIYSKYKLVAATSDSDAKKQNLAFQTNTTLVTGYPRNDIFFESNTTLIQQIKERYNLLKYSEIILYTPTHRDEVFEKIEAFSEDFWEKLQSYLEENNSLFIVKRHPADQSLKVPIKYKNIHDWTDIVSDIQEFLLITDLLITDYSSIATDFAITGRPILIYAYDLKKYIKQVRSMFYDLEDTLPQPILKTEQELLERIKDRSWQENPKVKESYDKFKLLFHKYLDGNSSKRVTEEILKL